VAVAVDVRLQFGRVAGEDAEDFVAVVGVAVDGDVDRGVAQVGRDLHAGDGHGGEVEAAVGEDFIEGAGDLAVEEGVEAECAVYGHGENLEIWGFGDLGIGGF